MQFHAIANIFPMLEESELSSLAADIKANGLKTPIVTYEGEILDGRNRFRACQMADVTPSYTPFHGDRRAALSHVWSLNVQRRHLNSSQAAIADAKRKQLDDQYGAAIAAIAEAKRERPGNGGDRRSRFADPSKVDIIHKNDPINQFNDEIQSSQLIDSIEKPQDHTKRTEHHRATSAGTNRTYIKQADKIISSGRTDLVEAIEKGKMTITQAQVVVKREEKLEEAKQAAQQAEARKAAAELRHAGIADEAFSLDKLSSQLITMDDWYLVDTWGAVEGDIDLFVNEGSSKGRFNEQDNESIEWARWSWNPVTGCEHGCPYCYARDIANRFYEQKFVPSIWPNRLNIPRSMNVPAAAQEDISYKNVFTCSMADLFGRWVPLKWIELVMDSVRKSPEWNFLFLTKFPQRIHELGELPSNAWMGTSVDCQSRVSGAEKAFAKIGGGTKWLSIEPMLTPLKFRNLELFDWVVIGGASESSSTPKWVPPMDWLVDLHKQARDSNCRIYYKSNLELPDALRIKEFPWFETPSRTLPDSMKYLGIK